jgi:tetratricopeptide (TPR) repeat protein
MRRYASLLNFTIVMSCILAVPLQSRAQTAPNPGARALFVEGQTFWDVGKFVDAEKKFREALTKYPKAEQSDRTSYYLITTLVKLGRVAEARTEIQNFYRNYPQSPWTSDVEEKRLSLNGLPSMAWGQNQLRVGARGPVRGPFPPMPFGHNVAISHPPNPVAVYVNSPAMAQEILGLIIEMDLSEGIRISRDRLKGDPSDPAVVANLNTIASRNSPQVITFLVTVAGNSAVPPDIRSQAIFFMGRQNNAGSAFVEVMKATESMPVVADAMNRFSVAQRRRTLDQIAQSPSADKTVVLEKLYRVSVNPQVRSQVVESVGSIPDPSTLVFLSDVAQNEKEPVVRQVAVQSLMNRKDVTVPTLEGILKTLPRRGTPAPAK